MIHEPRKIAENQYSIDKKPGEEKFIYLEKVYN
jgi:hypothetical protein